MILVHWTTLCLFIKQFFHLFLTINPSFSSSHSLWIILFEVLWAHSEPSPVPVWRLLHFDLLQQKTSPTAALRPGTLRLLAQRSGLSVHVLWHPQLGGGCGGKWCLQGGGLLHLSGAQRLRERGSAGVQQPVLGAVSLRRGLFLLPRGEEGAPAGGEETPEDRPAAGLAQWDAVVLRARLQRCAALLHTLFQRPPAASVCSYWPQHHYSALTRSQKTQWPQTCEDILQCKYDQQQIILHLIVQLWKGVNLYLFHY